MTTLYPWPVYRDPWQLAIEQVSFDGAESDRAVDQEHPIIQAQSDEWDTVNLQVVCETDQKGLVADQSAHIVVSAGRSLYQSVFPLTRISATKFHGTIELSHDNLAGAALIWVEISAMIDGRVRTIGRSITWRFIVDGGRRPAIPGAPPVEFEWVDFTNATAPGIARSHPDAHVVVSTRPEPRIFLNAGMTGLKEILYADTAQLEKRNIRELIASGIAKDILSALARDALIEIDPDDPVEPDSPLLSSALGEIAKVLAISTSELIDQYLAAGDATSQAAFWTFVDLAVAKATGQSVAVGEAAERVSRG